MPAPLMAFRFKDGCSFSVLDLKPDGRTTFADAHAVGVSTLIDESLRRAKASKGSDAEGYRAEFIRLVEKAKLLDASTR